MRGSAFALGVGLVLGGIAVPPALAQDPPAATAPSAGAKIEHVDPANRFMGMGRAPEGVKRVSPGALLLASFDRNFDGKVSRAEVSAAAPGAFAIADKNKDDRITGFEQTDWAASVGSQGEVIANSTMFDANLDRVVTQEEFAKGLLRLADEVMGLNVNEIAFADLMRPLSGGPEPERAAASAPAIVARPSGSQVSPTVVGQ